MQRLLTAHDADVAYEVAMTTFVLQWAGLPSARPLRHDFDIQVMMINSSPKVALFFPHGPYLL
jgi:hypothetical protein